MANADGSANVRINERRYKKLKEARLEAMIAGHDEIKISELVGLLIDEYLIEIIKDLKKQP